MTAGTALLVKFDSCRCQNFLNAWFTEQSLGTAAFDRGLPIVRLLRRAGALLAVTAFLRGKPRVLGLAAGRDDRSLASLGVQYGWNLRLGGSTLELVEGESLLQVAS